MAEYEHLLIFGASARAAAFSALRASLRPWCADLFADADLHARCPAQALPPGAYPQGFARLSERGPAGPWLYTGGLENRRALVRRMARRRPLWGNDAAVLARARSPLVVRAVLRAAGIRCPEVRRRSAEIPARGRWLVKPWFGAGGLGIRFWDGDRTMERRKKRVYYQEYVAGDACAAVYIGDGSTARLLGVTQQLVGQGWLHAAPFRYCGSIGPVALEPSLRHAFERLGAVLAAGCGLRGLFGVDCILCEGLPWPVEINPRYTASVEVLEYASGTPLLALHRDVFERHPVTRSSLFPQLAFSSVVGKAILFARAPLTFPEDGPWLGAVRQPCPLEEVPAFADIPRAGMLISAGQPILTCFARAGSSGACAEALRRTVADLDRWLFAS
jgi:predicted ATP-grasp superfamily ATP-dependent carboligase